MFEYFLIDSHQEAMLEPPEEINSAFGDYLSEMCALLEWDGFAVNTEHLEWRSVFVQVNTDYLGRIMNNVISNLEKYGDRGQAVQIALLYRQKTVGISVKNSVALPDEYVEGTGIGVKNISLMMEKMGGSVEVDFPEGAYRISLYFPVCEKEGTDSDCGKA